MLKDSRATRILIKLSILLLRSIAPVCITYCCFRLAGWTPNKLGRFVSLLDTYAALEAAFYLAFYLPRKWFLNRPAKIDNPLPLRNQRRVLFVRAWDSTYDVRRYLSEWFYGAPIEALRRDDIRDFITWRLWSKRTPSPEDEEELEEYVKYMESVLDWHFPPGRSGMNSMMVTFEPLRMLHRPLIWYLVCIGMVDLQMWSCLSWYGYKHYRLSTTQLLSSLPFRPPALLTNRYSPARHTSYWYHGHTSQSSIPILFIHGIGIGLWPYMPFLKEHLESNPETGLIALEILPISSRITQPFLPGPKMAKEIVSILRHHNWSRCILASHSYGSVIATHLLQDPVASQYIDNLVFIDPVAFSFHTPDVPYNFLRRQPKTASEFELYYFAATDADVSHALTRSFIWPENSLWREDVEHRQDKNGRILKTTVAICGKDIITDTLTLGRYLTRQRHPDPNKKWYHEEEPFDDDWKHRPWTGDKALEVMWFPDFNHAELFDDPGDRTRLLEVLRLYSRDIYAGTNGHKID